MLGSPLSSSSSLDSSPSYSSSSRDSARTSEGKNQKVIKLSIWILTLTWHSEIHRVASSDHVADRCHSPLGCPHIERENEAVWSAQNMSASPDRHRRAQRFSKKTLNLLKMETKWAHQERRFEIILNLRPWSLLQLILLPFSASHCKVWRQGVEGFPRLLREEKKIGKGK